MTNASGGIHLWGLDGQRYWIDPAVIEQITELGSNHEFGPKTILYLRHGRELHVSDPYDGIVRAIADTRLAKEAQS